MKLEGLYLQVGLSASTRPLKQCVSMLCADFQVDVWKMMLSLSPRTWFSRSIIEAHGTQKSIEKTHQVQDLTPTKAIQKPSKTH